MVTLENANYGEARSTHNVRNESMIRRFISIGLAASLIMGLSLTTGCGIFKKKKKGDGRNEFVTASLIDQVDPEGIIGMNLNQFDLENMTQVEGSFDPVYFAYDSARIPAGERDKPQPVADMMSGDSGLVLVLEGNCDERGSREYNMTLGEQRGLAVREYLVGLGIDPNRMQTRSYGEENPAVAGHTEDAYRLNRRVEFQLFR